MKIKTSAKTISLLIVTSLAVAATSGAVEAAKSDFSGAWKLNEKLSENPKKKIRKAFSEGFSPGISIGGGPGGRRSAGDGPDPGQAELERLQSQMAREIRAEMSMLVIEHREPRLRILYGNDHVLVLDTEGKEVSEERRLESARVRATWDDSSLVLKRILDSGREIEEHWQLHPVEKRLVINHRSFGGKLPVVEIRFVYDSAPPP
jgi:hypothetical protein